MKRRTFLKTGGMSTVGIVGLAGCIGDQTDDGATETTTEAEAGQTETTTEEPSGTLTVATYSSFVDAPSSSPGPWVKEQFEAKYPDATIEWQTPENELNYFIQRRAQGVDIDTDVYVGLNVDHLIRIDEKLPDERLFEPMAGSLSNYGHVKDGLKFDPKGRAIPYDTGYISLVYDENEVENPGTFDALLDDAYEGQLIVQNARTSATGRAFLLWTIHAKGTDGYLDYWQKLVENDAKILGSWDSAYAAYENGEAPMVVSYSTDQVYANRYDQDMSKHQVGFLDGQGYANPEGMAKFADTDNPELADAFLEFMLSKEVQSEIPTLNVQFPATDWAEPGEEFETYAYEPEEPVTYTYDELKGNVDQWIDSWARQIASK